MTHHDTDQGPDRHRHGADPAMGALMMAGMMGGMSSGNGDGGAGG